MEASRAVAVEVGGVRQVVADYVTLTKPRVQLLLLLTTVTTMYVAGDPSPSLVALTVLGGYLSAGGAGAVNHYWDRDIDARMARTATRPIPAGRVSPRAALLYGLALAALSFLLLATTVNLLSAFLALAGFLGYVLVYTMWLKRSPATRHRAPRARGAALSLTRSRAASTLRAYCSRCLLRTPPPAGALAPDEGRLRARGRAECRWPGEAERAARSSLPACSSSTSFPCPSVFARLAAGRGPPWRAFLVLASASTRATP